ncbi:hypothetical protein POG22_13475 [Geitlerinema sp. CS-897]|uniref:hypothetical protein n=1 Tax=Baaleninema simplex TaxID=2862350 RepID=UPI00034DFB60|nr:hypothetical protein [Baaleninema simplex]MDC0834007.1 hypothetical protein [Geitlerinema sp. CS-897]
MSATKVLQSERSPNLKARTMIRLNGRLSTSPNAIERLMRGDITQRFSRFRWFRQSYSWLQNIRQKLPLGVETNAFNPGSPVVLADASLGEIVSEVKTHAVAFGLRIPEATVSACLNYANRTACTEPGYDRPFFIGELDETGRLPDGHRPLRALAIEPETCPGVAEVASDPLLHQIASTYLRYSPTQITSHLTWSLASDLPETELRTGYPPTNYHYDIAGYNFVTAYFYITPVADELSGPHVMVRGSHHHKPLGMLLKSGRHTDEAIAARYGSDRELVICGDAGFGFFQDPSCFHKLKAPTRQHRLLLQVRYS